MNKNLKYSLIVLFSIVVIIIGIGFFIHNNGLSNIVFKEPAYPQFAIGRGIDEVLSPEEMKEDLLQLKKDLEEVHPKTIEGLSDEMLKAFEAANEIIKEPMTVSDFTIVASELACMLEDAHTAVRGFYSLDLSLPMAIKVIDDTFYVLEGKDLEPKDKIISFGGVPIKEIYEKSQKRIPSENIYWTNYNFEKYALLQSTLTQMGAEINNKKIDVVVNRNGENITVEMKFGDVYFKPINESQSTKTYKTYPQDTAYNPQFLYHLDMDNSLCHFVLKSCDNSAEYRHFLQIMFEDIQKNNIKSIVADVRQNTGGNSSVLDEFLKYVDVDKYASYGSLRRLSQQGSEQRGYVKTKGTMSNPPGLRMNNKMKDFLFDGDIYVLIDNGTFSSGNWFGVIISDSEIGTIVGEPSGNAPTSYGDILSFQLKNSKLMYFVSYSQWIRPNEAKRYEDALYPDFQVRYTIDDYLNKKDLAMEKVLELINDSNQ
ncbi:Peptidase family S41 [Proteiniborus ethanoligenes]|uniref:Peptidase family S41 n=1 Tax=Proteiniborus ethanoligenes TaxID=415015 RepID=A0A1H3NSE2_9FIRM|nr:S41 family peptidase [Proteiniborus ethanoligenes]SDY91610.1 Peptidase family S41 [Proteiniborus ethanoligenes]